MGLVETQRLLAHLYTDSDLRERFFADPESIGAEWGLSDGDIQEAKALSAVQVKHFARSLQAKRLGEIRKLLPQTCRLLGPRVILLFRQFADQSVPSGIHKHRADALAFAAFLKHILPEETALRDSLHYEAGWLTASDSQCRWHVCRTRTRGRPALALWWRWFPGGRLRHRMVRLP